MKKYLAIALLSGLVLGFASLSQTGDAMPFSPEYIASPGQDQVLIAKDPRDGWEIPSTTDSKGDKAVPTRGDDGKPVIQVALLLDTSGSMSSLIDQAKTELWSVVNKLGEARYKGKVPTIEVALYEYGKSSLQPSEGYIKQLAPFTNDLDGLSEILFGLSTNGGEEYCPWVIRSALQSLRWKNRPGSLRMIFIAGNESFTQGPVEMEPVLAEANATGILVHPILCAVGYDGDQASWNRAATLARTDLKVIDHTRVVSIPKTPYDEKIAELGRKLNATYVGYGQKKAAMEARQMEQDSNMSAISNSAAAERSMAKASPTYQNANWDLVDKARAEGAGSVSALKDEELPSEMRAMSSAEKTAYIERKAQDRKSIQSEINELAKKREAYISSQKKDSTESTLGATVINAVQKQAKQEGFSF